MKTAYIIACFLLVLAVVLDLGSKRSYSMAARSHAMGRKADQLQWNVIKTGVVTAHSMGDRQRMGGMVAAGLGLAFWYASEILKKFDEKRKTPVVPLLLLIAYGLLFFMAV